LRLEGLTNSVAEATAAACEGKDESGR